MYNQNRIQIRWDELFQPASVNLNLKYDFACTRKGVHLRFSGLPARPNHGTCLQPNLTFILPSHCLSNRSPGHTFPGVLSDFFSTVCVELAATNSSDQRLCLFLKFLNQDLKLFYSLRLSPNTVNTDPTCRQHLWSYDRMTLYVFDYFIIIIVNPG